MNDPAKPIEHGQEEEPKKNLLSVVRSNPDNAILPIDKIDLGPLHGIGITEDPNTAFDVKGTVRYIYETAYGPTEDETFAKKYEQIVGHVLGEVALDSVGASEDINDRLAEIYDQLDESGDTRIIELLQRVRRERILPEKEFTTVNKLCLLMTDT